MRTKLIFSGGLVLAILAGMMVANAISPLWVETRRGTTANYHISVNDVTPTGQIVEMGITDGPIAIIYDVLNDGNVPITVSATISATGCSPILNATSVTIDAGKTECFELKIIDFTGGDWQYTITFDKV